MAENKTPPVKDAPAAKVEKKAELSKEEVVAAKKAELEKEFEITKNQFNETVAEIRYIERLLTLKDQKDELAAKMDGIREEYSKLN